jgi:hypothetical protein
MNYSRKVCSHDKIIVGLNADKDEYWNYETRRSRVLIGNGCVRFHDSEELVLKVSTQRECQYKNNS